MVFVKLSIIILVVDVIWWWLIRNYIRNDHRSNVQCSLWMAGLSDPPWYVVVNALLNFLAVLGIIYDVIWFLFLR